MAAPPARSYTSAGGRSGFAYIEIGREWRTPYSLITCCFVASSTNPVGCSLLSRSESRCTPAGRPALTSPAAQQIGYFRPSGSLETGATRIANDVDPLVEAVVPNYLALHNETPRRPPQHRALADTDACNSPRRSGPSTLCAREARK